MRVPNVKPRLPIAQILEMNLGCLDLQFSFGLHEGKMALMHSYLGTSQVSLSLLQRA